MNPNYSKRRNVLRQIIDYVVGVVIAGLLMMWGTMNFVTNLAELQTGESGQAWWLAMLFGTFTILLPFGFGVWMISRQMKIGRQKTRANSD